MSKQRKHLFNNLIFSYVKILVIEILVIIWILVLGIWSLIIYLPTSFMSFSFSRISRGWPSNIISPLSTM